MVIPSQGLTELKHITKMPPTLMVQEAHADNGVSCLDKFKEQYSMKEVSKHCEPGSCWIVIEDLVYDVTQFLDEHPGGPDVLLENVGRDCTIVFKDKGHSTAAINMLQNYCIGALIKEDRINP